MSLVHLGSLSLGACVPLAAAAKAELDAGVAVSLGEIQAKLAGALEAQARLTVSPPSLASSLEAALGAVANLQAAIALGLPGASLDLSGMLAVIAELQASLGQLQASLAFSADFGVTLGTPGIHLYRYSGAIGELGDEAEAALGAGLPTGGGAGLEVGAVLLIASDGGAQAALDAMFA